MVKIILFNGPPGSGKDYAANYVADKFNNVRVDKFARILKEKTHALYGFHWRAWNHYEDCKDIPNDDFFGLTPRQAYIGVSEKYFKPMHNKRIFGEMLLRDIQDKEFDILAISDSGFIEEAEVLIEKYGAENTMLVKINRDGYDFSSDSRSYIELPNIKISVALHNEGGSNFEQHVYDLVYQFLNTTSDLTSVMDLFIESVHGLPCTKTFEETRKEIEDSWTKPSLLKRLGRLIGIR